MHTDNLSRLACIAIDAFKILAETNTLDTETSDPETGPIHTAALRLVARSQYLLGVKAGIIDPIEEEASTALGDALREGVADSKQVNEALALAAARTRKGPLADSKTLYLIEGSPIQQHQIDDGVFPPESLGKTEWGVSDGPPGERGYSEDFDSFDVALESARQFEGATIIVDLNDKGES